MVKRKIKPLLPRQNRSRWGQSKWPIIHSDRLDELPEAIRPERVRIRPTKNKGLAFFSEWAYLSNMYSTRFVCNNKVYMSVEQCYQWEKAIYHKKWAMANRIFLTDDPYKCKKHGGTIETSNEWMGVRENIMRSIVREKFRQNQHLLVKLIDTGTARLYEAVAGNSIWSTNSSFYSKATFDEMATGPNVLGGLLEELRGEFIANNGGAKGAPTGIAPD